MAEYQVIARKYRPQTFRDVVAQEAIVTTLKNAIKHERLAHAYLFCGSRGTGKTTLARIFAKALNCANLSDDLEPCNSCSSCKEIALGTSLEVLEIDGASHRGIDDIRQINETVGYSTSSGGYKVYIIDEVHMLTKEAFNALLKTLEEPPKRVAFFFATTEPHKVPPTILSRCQRFNLNRIPTESIINKLSAITKDLQVETDTEALRMIAHRADGGLRDAESLLDQIFSFHGKSITTETVASVLGIMPRDCLFELDTAGKDGRLSFAFEIVDKIFSEGKDMIHFVETLTEHFRNILLIKLSGKNASFLSLSNEDIERYASSAALYSQEQCMNILDYLVEAQDQIRFASSSRIALEAILLHIMRTHRRVPIEVLVRRLAQLEQSINSGDNTIANSPLPTPTPQPSPKNELPAAAIPPTSPLQPTPIPPIEAQITPSHPNPKPTLPPQAQAVPTQSTQACTPQMQTPPPPRPAPQPQAQAVQPQSTPSPMSHMQSPPPPPPSPQQPKARETKPQIKKVESQSPSAEKVTNKTSKTPKTVEISEDKLKKQSHYDTLLQFAAVELEGKLEKTHFKRS
ncbi:MAG: DNA polymerase III subunit gamma/tau [Chlamydiota bacterium]|nr:DNA polymerase III subunit gamma/tau [Chlamydiota bacterium]